MVFFLQGVSGETPNTLLFYSLWIVGWIIAYFYGTRWSTEFIEKRYTVLNRKGVIRRATVLLCVEYILFIGWALTRTALSPRTALDVLFQVIISIGSIGLFYFISKHYFLKKVHWNKFSIFLLVLFIAAVGATTYLVNQVRGNVANLEQQLTNDTQSPPRSIQEFRIVPVEDPSQSDMALVQTILQEEFPGITVVTGGRLDPSKMYDASRNGYAAELLALELGLHTSRSNQRTIGLTDQNLYVISDPANTFVVSGAFPNGKAVIISTFHLRAQIPSEFSRERFRERLQKSLRASLGTSFGFNRRIEKECVMSVATTLEELDKKGISWCGEEVEAVQRLWRGM